MVCEKLVIEGGGKNIFDLASGTTGMSLHVSPGDLLREQRGGRRKTDRKPEKKRQTIVGGGSSRAVLEQLEAQRGGEKLDTGCL